MICLVAPAVATFVHGDSGHTAACMPCAETIRQGESPRCPICRAANFRIIQNFGAPPR